MVEIRPFKAIRYTKKAGALKNLITQPYDKIDKKMQKEYYDKSTYNFCRLILPMESNRYEIARQRMQQWLSEGILAKDAEPAVFVCKQEFELFGKTCTRTGLIAASALHSFSENKVFPHEITYSAPKIDRLNMMRAIQKNLEPVFFIYSDPEHETIDFFAEIANTQPIVTVEDSFRVKHTLWKVTDPKKIKLLQKAIEDKIFVITDGHHRYESAIAYRDEMRKQSHWTENSAFNFHMSIMVPFQEEGLVVLPTHRLLKHSKLTVKKLRALGNFFTVVEIDPTIEALNIFLESHRVEHVFCAYDGAKAYGLLLKDEKSVSKFVTANYSKETRLLDVVILRDVIFKNILNTHELKMDEDILYVRWIKDAFAKVDSGEAKLAFLLNPISPETVWRIAQKSERMPEKSTDFYPKMVSGLMMMDISLDEKL